MLKSFPEVIPVSGMLTNLCHRGFAKKQVGGNGAHRASVFNLWSLQGNGDAVQEDEGQHNVVKELVSNDGLAEETKPAREFQ